MERDKNVTSNNNVNEQVRYMTYDINPTRTPPNFNSTRTFSPPLMGTYARAAKYRNEGDMGPVRIDNTDTHYEQIQRLPQNFRPVSGNEQSHQIIIADQSRPPSNMRQASFEQSMQRPSSTYDAPPLECQPIQKVITTITTTTKAVPTLINRSSSANRSSSTNEPPNEQTSQLQKSTGVTIVKNDANQARTHEQHSVNANVSENRVLINLPMLKTNGSTDLDKAQAHLNTINDDHQAIKHLSQALHEHNKTIVNEYKRLPSQTNSGLINTTITTTTTKFDPTSKPTNNEFTVIDALLDNPLGSYDDEHNNTLHKRFSNIVSNLKNSESANLSTSSGQKDTTNKSSKVITTKIVNTTIMDQQTPLKESTTGATSNSSEQNQSLSAKSKKKKDKENKKSKTKSKQSPKDANYQVIDALIGSPTSTYLPDEYLTKYKVVPPLSSIPCIASISNAIQSTQPSNTKSKNDTLHNLVNIVNELMLHHSASLVAATTVTKTEVQQSVKPTNLTQTVQPQQQQQPQKQQPEQPVTEANQATVQSQSRPVTPRVIYRYMDDQGNVLKLSSTPPSKLRESKPDPARQYSYRYIEPSTVDTRQMIRDDERASRRSEYEQYTARQDSSRPKVVTILTRDNLNAQGKGALDLNSTVPEQPRQYSYRTIETTYIPTQQVAKDDENACRRREYEQRVLQRDDPRPTISTSRGEFEQDRRRAQSYERPSSRPQPVPVTVEYRDSVKTAPPEQQYVYHHHPQENVSLTWLPLRHEQQPAYYNIDSTIHERAPTYRTYEYVPTQAYCCHNNQAVPQNVIYRDQPSGHACYSCPTLGSYISSSPLSEYECHGCPRNYIEVFRGDEVLPSEVYSLPLNEILAATHRYSYVDENEHRKDGDHIRSRSSQRPSEKFVSSKSTHELHRQNMSPSNSNYDITRNNNQLSQSKSFDYRPLRTKLLREHDMASRLISDESNSYPTAVPAFYYRQTNAS